MKKIKKLLLSLVPVTIISTTIVSSCNPFFEKYSGKKPIKFELTHEQIQNLRKKSEIEVSQADLQVINEEKSKLLSKIKNSIGEGDIDLKSTYSDISKSSYKSDDKLWLKNITSRVYQVRHKFLDTLENVYKLFWVKSDNRYQTIVSAFKKFVNNYWTDNSFETGPFVNKKPVIKELFSSLKNKNYFSIIFSDLMKKYYEYYLDELEKYLGFIEKHYQLSFNKDDGLKIDLEKIDFLTKIPKLDYISQDEIKKIRHDLVFNGSFSSVNKQTNEVINNQLFVSYKPLNEKLVDPITHEKATHREKIMANFFDVYHDVFGWDYYYSANRGGGTHWLWNPKDQNKSKDYIISFLLHSENAEEEKKVNNLILETIPKIISKNFTKDQQIFAVHNWITDRVDYDETLKLPNNSRTISFVNKTNVVCEGYASMFEKFMTFLSIPSLYVTGDVEGYSIGHAWNMVYLNGRKYFVDCTWDDPIVAKNIHSYIDKSITPHSFDYLLLTYDELQKKSKRRKKDPNVSSYAKSRDFGRQQVLQYGKVWKMDDAFRK